MIQNENTEQDRNKIIETLKPAYFDTLNDSYMHNGPAGYESPLPLNGEKS